MATGGSKSKPAESPAASPAVAQHESSWFFTAAEVARCPSVADSMEIDKVTPMGAPGPWMRPWGAARRAVGSATTCLLLGPA